MTGNIVGRSAAAERGMDGTRTFWGNSWGCYSSGNVEIPRQKIKRPFSTYLGLHDHFRINRPWRFLHKIDLPTNWPWKNPKMSCLNLKTGENVTFPYFETILLSSGSTTVYRYASLSTRVKESMHIEKRLCFHLRGEWHARRHTV
jgi:hypothetical protein